ncbi:MAG TPA: NYN domain-containing protein [Desulfotomaculum sp.]|nr:NYN domain-containing protein [Desulfotomaculum sp.]
MREIIIVDGYNMIFTQAAGKQVDLAHARERLLNQLLQYAVLAGVEVVVVFDAYRVKGGKEHAENRGGLTVIFTAEGEAADTVIERLCAQLSDRFIISVVTADWAEQRLALGYGALRVTPKEFDAEVNAVIQRHQDQVPTASRPADDYIESRLAEDIKTVLSKWRQGKG